MKNNNNNGNTEKINKLNTRSDLWMIFVVVMHCIEIYNKWNKCMNAGAGAAFYLFRPCL